MKKYLFLIGLFILYLILIINHDSTKEMVLYKNDYNQSVIDVTAKFNTGINSKKLINLFDDIKSNYYVYKISYDDKSIKTSCNKIEDCIYDIYDEESNLFDTIYLVNGFSIKDVSFLSDTNNIITFLDDNDIKYDLKLN